MATESASLGWVSGITPRLTSHLRAQFSRDLEQLSANTNSTQSSIYNWMEDFGQSSTLPRQTREQRLQLAETLSWSRGRNQWKFGGDVMRTWDYNYFPSLYGGKYLYDNIAVNPFTFVAEHGGLVLTPLRAWAHNVPRYYEQSFGNPVSHPDSNDYSGFVQDTIRLTPHFSLSLGRALRPANVFYYGNDEQSAVGARRKDAVERDEFCSESWYWIFHWQ